MAFYNRLWNRSKEKAVSPVPNRRPWASMRDILEPFTGAWQRGIKHVNTDVKSNYTVFSCVTLIASDISKLRIKFTKLNKKDKIWEEYPYKDVHDIFSRPNHFQTRNQFFECWLNSKLLHGNTYVLKVKNKGKISSLYVLDPSLVTPLVADNGDVFYQLGQDNLSGISTGITVPATEIIHDRFNTLYHPLVGMSPLFASAMVAEQGLFIVENSTAFFAKGSTAPGILVAPKQISDETAQRLKKYWEENYSNGNNAGKIAVLGDGLKYEQMSMSAVDSQMLEQLQWTATAIASTFHVPPRKIGISITNETRSLEVIDLEYYTQCLQRHIEDIEACLDQCFQFNGIDEGLEFEIDGLARMDTASLVRAEADAVGAGIKSPNEARRKFDLEPVKGGDAPYLQQQNYSLEALAKRDVQQDPFNRSDDKPAEQPQSANNELSLQVALSKKLGLKTISIK